MAVTKHIETIVPNDIFYDERIEEVAEDMHYSHYHSSFEVYYLVKGERCYFIDDNIFYINTGDIILIPPNILHNTASISERGYERILINFNEHSLNDGLRTLFDDNCLHIPEAERKTVLKMLKEIGKEFETRDEFAKGMLENKVHALLVYLLRLKRENPEISKNKVHSDRIKSAMNYINEHFSEQLTLQNVADSLYISREHFSTTFKKETGFGFSEYLNQVRIANAMKLLQDTSASITNIAYDCGFNDNTYFTVVFKKINGISPKKYQQNCRKDI